MSDQARKIAEASAWIVAVLIVIGMGILVKTGPFHHINKVQASVGAPVNVQIVSDPKVIGLYKPATITLRVGQYAIFTNSSNANHTVTAEKNNAFNSGDIGTGGAQWTFKATKPGTYPYICQYHPLMHGTLVVTG
ncbi:MAG: hypothetical protein NVSMB52_13860 [Chloroflexota bacterium]